ncbi:MAG: BON domain-containing protein [Gemmatales bacterium]|nr:BON domain-containing protein [Gemmatales bacterium]MDW8385899.1 BON domain-containing protein [Gemmatales bacterium]
MRSRFIRGSAAFVLAGLTGWPAAWGQEFGFVPPTTSPSAGSVAPVDTDQFQTCFLAIEVELLADAATFPYHLKIVPSAQGVELRGYVPSALIRDRALAAARRVCPLPVADGLVVQRNMSLPLPTKLPKDLETQVRQKLAEVCPGSPIEVKVNESGTVHLTGSVPTLQHKAECSRVLRKVPGVTAVRNHLETGHGTVAYTPPPRHSFPTDALPVRPSEPVRPVQPPTEPTIARTTGSVSPVTVTSTSRPAATQSASEPTPSEPPRRFTLMPPPPVTPAPGTLSSEVAERMRPSSAPGSEIQPVSATNVARPSETKTPEKPSSVATKPSGLPFGVAPIPDGRSQTAMKTRIQSVVGPQLRTVDLLFDGRGGLTLILYIDKDADINQTINRIIQVPELSGYELRMDFKMVQ